MKEEAKNGHWMAFDGLCERLAVKFIGKSRCIEPNELEETSIIERCKGEEGQRLLSSENGDYRKQFLDELS